MQLRSAIAGIVTSLVPLAAYCNGTVHIRRQLQSAQDSLNRLLLYTRCDRASVECEALLMAATELRMMQRQGGRGNRGREREREREGERE